MWGGDGGFGVWGSGLRGLGVADVGTAAIKCGFWLRPPSHNMAARGAASGRRGDGVPRGAPPAGVVGMGWGAWKGGPVRRSAATRGWGLRGGQRGSAARFQDGAERKPRASPCKMAPPLRWRRGGFHAPDSKMAALSGARDAAAPRWRRGAGLRGPLPPGSAMAAAVRRAAHVRGSMARRGAERAQGKDGAAPAPRAAPHGRSPPPGGRPLSSRPPPSPPHSAMSPPRVPSHGCHPPRPSPLPLSPPFVFPPSNCPPPFASRVAPRCAPLTTSSLPPLLCPPPPNCPPSEGRELGAVQRAGGGGGFPLAVRWGLYFGVCPPPPPLRGDTAVASA